jgi:hypothetical protein
MLLYMRVYSSCQGYLFYNSHSRLTMFSRDHKLLTVYDDSAALATVKSWDKEFVGDISTRLLGILRFYMNHHTPTLYARVVPHVQSSGTGKSRAHDELAKYVLYIPLNLAGSDTACMLPLCALLSLHSRCLS